MASLINRAPLWDPDNPIGTDTILPQQSVGMPRPSEDARTVGGGLWGQSRPIAASAVRDFGEGSMSLYEQAAMAAMGGEAPRGSAVPPRIREPVGGELAGRRAEVISPNEQYPGDVTGLNAGPMSRQQFSDASSWRDPITGKDRLIEDVTGRSGQAVPVTGAYTNAAGVIERNPGMASRYLVDRFPGQVDSLTPAQRATMSATEATRGLIDFQEGQPYYTVNTEAPSSLANSLKIVGKDGRVPTPEEMIRLGKIADKYGMTPSNSPDGISFLNFSGPGDNGFRSGLAVEQDLRQGMRDEIQAAFPGAKVARGKAGDATSGGYIDYSGQIGYGQRNQGTAVKALADHLEEMKVLAPQEYLKLIQSPAVQAKAQQNIERLVLSGQVNVRPDYVRMLNIVSGGRLEALLKHMLGQGSGGLPAVAGTVGPGIAAAAQAGSSDTSP